MDASREGEVLFQRGRLREERLGMKVRPSIQVVGGGRGRGSAKPLVRLYGLQKGQKKRKKNAESERDCLNRSETGGWSRSLPALAPPGLLNCWKSLDGWDPAPLLYPTRPLLVVPENEARGMEPLSSPFIKTWWAVLGSIEFSLKMDGRTGVSFTNELYSVYHWCLCVCVCVSMCKY